MDSGSEITAKIRSAIKAKLVELGAYVDDELPDYIMVMIANKKTKEQMTNDLNLFLGKNSSIFTDWVHSVLDRLQAISQKSSTGVGGSGGAANNANSGGHSNSGATYHRSASNEKDKKSITCSSKGSRRYVSPPPPTEPIRKQFPVNVERKRKPSPITYNRESSTSKENKEREYHHGGNSRNSRRRGGKDRTVVEDIVVATTDSGKKGLMTDIVVGSSMTSNVKSPPVDDEDILDMAMTIAGDAMDLDIVGHKESPVHNENSRSAHKRGGGGHHNTSTDSARSSQKVGTVRPMRRRSRSPDDRHSSSRKRRSVVKIMPAEQQKSGHQSNYYDDYDEDEEKRLIKKRHQMDSIVKVTERKYNVPTAMQPRPSIFLKALNEANESVSRHKSSRKSVMTEIIEKPLKITVHEEEISEEEEYKEEPIYEEYEPMQLDQQGNVEQIHVSPEPDPMPITEEQELEHEDHHQEQQIRSSTNNINITNDTRRVELKETSNIVEKQHQQQTSQELLLIDQANITNAAPTRFVVTLDGVSSSFIKKIQQNQDGGEDDGLQQQDSNGGDADESENREEEEELEGTEESHEESLVQFPNASAQSACTKDTEDDEDTLIVGLEDEDFVDEDQELPATQVNEVKICLDDDDDEDENDESSSVVNTLLSEDGGGIGGEKIMERCKYWPVCKLGANCSFHHPTVPCKTFPKCRYGDRCLYIHPNCRYDSFCTNQHCPFSHSGRYREAAAPITAPTTKTIVKTITTSAPPIACKFGGRCLNPSCAFTHPKPCIYGANCLRPDCLFSHPMVKTRPVPLSALSSSATGTQKFKWVAPKSIVTSTINVLSAPMPSAPIPSAPASTAVKTS